MILGKLLCDQLRIRDQEVLQLDKLSEAARLERTDFTHDGSDLLAHLPLEMLERDKTAYRNSDILLLTRDLRDLMVSCYFQAVARRSSHTTFLHSLELRGEARRHSCGGH